MHYAVETFLTAGSYARDYLIFLSAGCDEVSRVGTAVWFDCSPAQAHVVFTCW